MRCHICLGIILMGALCSGSVVELASIHLESCSFFQRYEPRYVSGLDLDARVPISDMFQ